MKLTKNITLEECIYSPTAKRLGIDNIPNGEVIKNLSLLANKVLQPIRSYFNKPLIITSGYRCERLNKAIKGANKSQHKEGKAADFHVKGVSFEEVIKYIKENLDYDQLIDENTKTSRWIHVSYSETYNRKQNLVYKNGRYTRM